MHLHSHNERAEHRRLCNWIGDNCDEVRAALIAIDRRSTRATPERLRQVRSLMRSLIDLSQRIGRS